MKTSTDTYYAKVIIRSMLFGIMVVFISLMPNEILALEAAAQHYEAQGIDIELDIADKSTKTNKGSVEDNKLTALFKFKSKASGIPIENLKPKAWLALRRSEQIATETSCEAKVRSFASGQLATRADVDLNSYYLLTLNQDKTVAFINPQVSWSSSQLEGIVQLPAQGLDWVLTKDGKWLYVTMPDAAAIALIDTTTHSLVTTIPTGLNSKPTRIALSPDELSVWAGLDGLAKVAIISRTEKPKVSIVNVAEGLHHIGFTPDSSLAVVTNSKASSVSVIDVANLKKLADIKVGNTPIKATWVDKAERFYIASVNDSAMSVVDPIGMITTQQIDVGHGTVDIAADPQGRYVWAVNHLDAKAYIIDSATNKKIAYAKLTNEPDQIAFTAGYAYFRGLNSEKFTLVNRTLLDKLPVQASGGQEGKLTELSVTEIQAGEKPPSSFPEAIGVAAMIAPLPEQNGVMVANAPSKSIYYYLEGMMVPMGTLTNYRRIPLALMILDRSLQETAPGVFEVPVSVQKPGNYDVAIMIDQPRIIHCFTAKLEGNMDAPKQKEQVKVKPLLLPLKTPPQAKAETFLSFKLEDTATGKPITGIQDARLLAFEPPGLWQKREWLQEINVGTYQAVIIFPHAGKFDLLVEARSRELGFTGQTITSLKVVGDRE